MYYIWPPEPGDRFTHVLNIFHQCLEVMLCISGSGHLEAAAQVIKKTHTHTHTHTHTAATLGTQNQQKTDGEERTLAGRSHLQMTNNFLFQLSVSFSEIKELSGLSYPFNSQNYLNESRVQVQII